MPSSWIDKMFRFLLRRRRRPQVEVHVEGWEGMQEVLRLCAEDEALCALLETEPFHLSLEVVPTEQQLAALKLHVKRLNFLKTQRAGRFWAAKAAILILIGQLEDEPNGSFQYQQVACKDDDSVTLSSSNVLDVEEVRRQLEAKSAHLNKIVAKINDHKKRRLALAQELGATLADPEPGLSKLDLERFLRHEIESLEMQKAPRMQDVRRLCNEDEALCARLEMEPFHLSLEVIPTEEQLAALKQHVQRLTILKTERAARFSAAKAAIVVEFRRKLEANVEANRVKAEAMRARIAFLVDKLGLDAREKRVVAEMWGGHSLPEIEQLQKRCEELEFLKDEKMDELILNARRDLDHFWDLCYFSQNQRQVFAPYSCTDMTEELLEKHEKELETVTKYYEDNASLFKKVARRQALWRLMLDLQDKEKDTERLYKGGDLLILEEKDRNRVKHLPQLEAELRKAMTSYTLANGKPFLVGGKPYEVFLEEQKADYRRQQEAEREYKRKKATSAANLCAVPKWSATSARSRSAVDLSPRAVPRH